MKDVYEKQEVKDLAEDVEIVEFHKPFNLITTQQASIIICGLMAALERLADKVEEDIPPAAYKGTMHIIASAKAWLHASQREQRHFDYDG